MQAEPPASPTPAARAVLMFTDLVDSVALKSTLGERGYAEHLLRHDRAFRAIVGEVAGAAVRKDLGDGFLASFPSAAAAVAAALRFQEALQPPAGAEAVLQTRIGLHLGPITELDLQDEGHGKLVGLTADVAARIMGLALPGQVLMSREVFDGARESVRASAEDPRAALRWMAHGPYLFRGAERPLEVFEVGVNGSAPLRAPPDGEKARRAVPAGEEELYGWRPAAGLPVPGRLDYVLERRLGEGGFGEVWLARTEGRDAPLVFKFCFDAERVRGLRRELAIFRFAQQALGDRADIARIGDIRIESPPFWLQSEFTEQGDLADWSAARGGIERVPLDVRLSLLAQIADAVAAAHSVGILHKDLKPSNVLIWEDGGRPRPRLADFGIGTLTDPTQLLRHDITVVGFTEVAATTGSTALSGTRLYAPPETLAGKPFTTRGDVYALGVMLYQLVVGDLARPIGHGWESDVEDPLLREDIAACVTRRVTERLASAAELAERIRGLEARRGARETAAQEIARSARRRRRNRLLAGALALMVLLLGAAGLLLREEHRLRDLADVERSRADAERLRALRALETAEVVTRFLDDDLLGSVDPRESRGRDVTVREVLDAAAAQVGTRFAAKPDVEAPLQRTLGRVYLGIARYEEARRHLERARELFERLEGPRSLALAEVLESLALLASVGESEPQRALDLARRVVEIRTDALGPEHALTLRAQADVGMYAALREGKLAAGIDNPMMLTMLSGVRGRGETADEMRGELIRMIYEAERLWRADDREALRAFAETVAAPFLAKPAFAERVPWAWSAMARSLQADGRPEAALALCWSALAVGERRWGESHPQVQFAIQTMATLLYEQGDLAGAAEWEARNVRILAGNLGAGHARVLARQADYAITLLQLGRHAEAAAQGEAVHAARRAADGPTAESTRSAAAFLAQVFSAWGKPEESALWRKRAGE